MTAGAKPAPRPLAHGAIELPRLGIGCSDFGDRRRHMAQTEVDALVDAALAESITYFDVAPYYGFGLAERRLGDALRGSRRRPPIVSTKIGRLLVPDASIDTSQLRNGFLSRMPFRPEFDYSYDGVMRSHEASLQRLGIARIDILLVHDVGALAHGSEHRHYMRQLLPGGFKALRELKRAGDIRAFGLGVNETSVCHEILDETELDCILLAGRYTLLEQQSLNLLDRCAKTGTAIIAGGPYNSGLLAGGTRRTNALRYDYGEAPQHILDRVRRIETFCDRYGVPIAAAALQFPLGHPAVASVLPGIGSAVRVAETLDLLRFPIPADFWAELRAECLLSVVAPLPAHGGETLPA